MRKATAKINAENYYQDTSHLTYHMILDFQKCEYLFSQRLAGKVPRIEKDYFLYGQAFDSFLTGDFQENFAVGKKIDPKEALEKLEEAKMKSLEMIDRQSEKRTPKAQEIIINHRAKLAEYEDRIKEIEALRGKSIISESLLSHIEKSAQEFERQSIIKKFLRTKDSNQVILTGTIRGMKVKGRLDWFDPKLGIVDYKTTASMLRFDPTTYSGQMAWYQHLAFLKYKKKLPCYLFVIDKDTDNKHASFWRFKQETLDAKRTELLSIVDDVKGAIQTGLYTPAAEDNIQTCWSCPHYNTCPFTIQEQFYEV